MKLLPLFAVCFLAVAGSTEAAYVLQDGKLVNSLDAPRYSADRHYELGQEAMEECDYNEAVYNFNVISKNFPNASCYADAQFYLGVALFNNGTYDFANEAFTKYLHCQTNPQYFIDAIGYKCEIAARFAAGAKKHFFGMKQMPQWAPARGLAYEIYNEVIAALPCHEYAAIALYNKACMHWEDQAFRDSVETFQVLIRRFPKHAFTPEAYLNVNRVYLGQACCEFQNPDILAMAEINVKRFQQAFPKEERLAEAFEDVQKIKEMYAQGLFDTAQFYERIDQPEASLIYYRSAILQFPDTGYAKCSRRRIEIITSTLAIECETETECEDPSV